MAYCKWFKQISKKDIPIAGGKGANLGEMFNAGFPVPPGYIILASTYNQFLKEKKIDKKIQEKLQDINIEDSEQLQKIAKEIQSLFSQYQMSSEMKEEIQEFYQYIETDEELKNVKLAEGLLTNGRDLPFVAVRSSATAEDLPQASFAGQQASFLNIKGKDALIVAVQQCWASLFTARAIYYREKNNFSHMKIAIAVVIQKQINSSSLQKIL